MGRAVSRAERRALAERYRRVDVSHTCSTCGASLVATFVVERGDPTPGVMFIHKLDGGHEPVLSGNGIAAQARRSGQVVGQIDKVVRDD